MLDQLSLENVRIIDGALRYVDERGGVRHEMRALNADLTLSGIAGPVQAKGSLVLNNETLAFDGTLSPLRAVLLEAETARVTGRLAGRPIEATYDGTVSVDRGVALDGRIGLKAPSAEAVAAWLSQQVMPVHDSGALSLTSTVTADAGRVSLSRLQATLGTTTLSGSLTLDTRKERPHVGGDLRFTDLDLGRHSGAAAPAPDTTPAPRGQAPRVRDDDDRSQPRRLARGPGKRDGDWSDDPIDLALLALADADLSVSAERILFKDLTVGPGTLAVVLRN